MAETAVDVVEAGAAFALLSDDIVINILLRVDGDARDWARLACVCARFSALIRNVCYRAKCCRFLPSVVSDLLLFPSADADHPPPGGWTALHKLSVCCPGLLHAGILLENSDFGLERDIGPDLSHLGLHASFPSSSSSSSFSSSTTSTSTSASASTVATPSPPPDCTWSLFDDLYFDTVYDTSESSVAAAMPAPALTTGGLLTGKRKRHWEGPLGAHLAAGGAWSLSREQGNKLLASRFRGDSLYICDWPGCVHVGAHRKYMLFRGVFKDFCRSRVWRSIADGRRSKAGLGCAFCACGDTWDLHSAFCLRRIFGYHDDGEPEVRAFVCANGHVSGAWTERPMYDA